MEGERRPFDAYMRVMGCQVKGRPGLERPFGTSVVFDLVFGIMQSPSRRGGLSMTRLSADFLRNRLGLQELQQIIGTAGL